MYLGRALKTLMKNEDDASEESEPIDESIFRKMLFC